MRYVPRLLEPRVRAALRQFPALVLTGPRRSGKTYLLRRMYPEASYHLLEDPSVVARLREDPQGFLDEVELPAILDEVQNVPEVFAHVRARIDRAPRRKGRWILTGSQESSLMRGVTESMAGRAAILQLWPFSVLENPRVDLLRGGFPEAVARPRGAPLWFSSYVQSYLERDVRAVTNVHDLATFRRFLALLASRHGQILNKTDLAAPLGMSVPGIGQWLSILETTQQILIVPPYFENLGRRRELYYFRDQRGLEVDFVIPATGGATLLLEAKATRTPTPAMAAPIVELAKALRVRTRGAVRGYLVHRAARSTTPTRVLVPGVQALTLPELVTTL